MFRGVLLLAVVLSVCAINFEIYPGQKRCFNIKGDGQYHIEYVTSGSNQNLTTFEINSDERSLHLFENVAEHFETFNLPGGKGVDLCWSTSDDSAKLISANYFLATDPIRSLITKSDVATVEKSLTEAVNNLNTVSRNQLYQHERDNVHKTLLEETDEKIVFVGIVKIAVMLISAVLQIWIMRGFFKNTGTSYSEVAT